MVASVRIQSLIEIHLINFNYADIMTIHLLPTLGSIANIIDMINPGSICTMSEQRLLHRIWLS